jgi:hypothetical protein
MSEQQQARDLDRREPIRRAAPSRQSAAGPGDGPVTARHVAAYFRDDCRTLRDSLQLEMVVAQYLLQMRRALTPAGVPVADAVAAGVIAELEEYGDPLSHAILRGLAYLATGEVAQRSADAVARLAEHGVGLRAQFADVAAARVVDAWRTSAGGHRGEYALFVEFEHPLGTRHALALFVERRGGGTLKHIGLMNSMHDLDPDEPFHPGALEPLSIAAAVELLRQVLKRTFGAGVERTDDYRVLIAAARARAEVARAGDAK